MGLQRRLLLRATRVRMGQLVNRPGGADLELVCVFGHDALATFAAR